MKKFFGRFFKKKDNAFYNNLNDQLNTNDLMLKSNFANLPLVSRLENAWKMDFLANVKERVMEKEDWSKAKYAFIEKELKRFFLMAAIFENVPMYSQEVDKIWHEMILFTKSYQNFCKSFCGEMIHHEPNVKKNDVAITDTRAVYNLFYNMLYETTSVNTYILGNLDVNYKNTQVQEYLSSKTIQTLSFVSHINSQTKNKVLNEFARIQKILVDKENEEIRTKALKRTEEIAKQQSQKSYPSSAKRSSSSKKSDDGHINSTFLTANSLFVVTESSNDSSKSDSHHHNSHSSCSSSSHSSCSSSSHSSCSSSSCSSGCSS